MPVTRLLLSVEQLSERDSAHISRAIGTFLKAVSGELEPPEYWVALALYTYSEDVRDRILDAVPTDTRRKLQKAYSEITPVPFNRLAVAQAALLHYGNLAAE